MKILIDLVRILGFRGLKNIEVSLEPLTLITGMNNSGKTSFEKALQLVFGNRLFITPDDFYQSETNKATKILIDIRIIPTNEKNERISDFSDEWLIVLGDNRIRTNTEGQQFVPLRTVVTIDPLTNFPKTQQSIIQEWPDFKNVAGKSWHEIENGTDNSFHLDEVPFFYMDAQRDIIEDLKVRTSYLGKMLSKIEYSAEDIEIIENQIKILNEKAVTSSDILTGIATTLKDLDTAMDNTNTGVDITPFPKKIRDLNKGVSIQYSDFSMDYHGMGTRSWASLLTLKSFISLFDRSSIENERPFYPIIAIEEPEAHLHPNAQKKLYSQISGIPGQKIVSTHSSFVAASAELHQIRSFYKGDEEIVCGKINVDAFSSEDIRKIKRQVVNSRGELFFSKVIVFFEGETEEQALPIFAEKYFNKTSAEIGIDFIGVGGYGNYLPFLRVAQSLNIPWFIFSDAENTPDRNIKASVQKQFIDLGTAKPENDCIIFLSDGNDFEKQLIVDGYSDEIKLAIINLSEFQNDQHREAKVIEINGYSDEKIYKIITNGKTQYGPAIADEIVASNKALPPKIVLLFDKIKTTLKIED